MVDVDNDVELIGKGLIDGPIDALGEFRINRIRRFGLGMRGPIDRQADGVKAGLLDGFEILRLQLYAPLPFIGSLKRIAQVNAAAKLSIGGKDVGSLLIGAIRRVIRT